MDIKNFLPITGEKPLDNIVSDGGFTSIFRTIGCIGDSLSSGELESLEMGYKSYHDYFEYSWGQFMARDTGSKVRNFSTGGTSAKSYIESFADSKGYWNPDLRCQAYIIALGVNDVSGILAKVYPLGSADDINVADYTLNKQTFAGWYGAIISKYKEIQPHAKFFLMTVPKEESVKENEPERDKLYDKHAKLIYDIAEKFSNCFVLDFRQHAPLYDAEFKRMFFTGGHMNVMGYRLTAKMVESYIDYIIRHDADSFNKSGFIGKLHYNNGLSVISNSNAVTESVE